MTSLVQLPYTHPVVRDLAWVMAAPGLLQSAPLPLVSDDWCRQVLVRHHHRLCALDEQPAHLLDALRRSKHRRLGIYFEQLLLYWLQDILGVENLRHNLAVFRERGGAGKQTLGAFDFLFRVAPQSAIQHWEATVKFYLQKTMANGECRWVGPGERDRLDIKLQRMFGHQLLLSQRSEAQAGLRELGDAVVEAAAFIKGYLFYPLSTAGIVDDSAVVDLSPYVLSPEHLRGWWLRWGSAALPTGDAERRWMRLPKARWLSPLRLPQETADMLDDPALWDYCQGHFAGQQHDRQRPLMLVELNWQRGAWQEVSRGFVLPPA